MGSNNSWKRSRVPDSPPPECIALRDILLNRDEYPWYPAFADYCGTWGAQPFYRERPHEPEPPPPPPPAGDPPGDCVSRTELETNSEDYPWWPNGAAYCGHFHNQDWYRPGPPPPPPPPSDEGGDRADQPQGDVGDDEAPSAFVPPDQDDLDPFDPD